MLSSSPGTVTFSRLRLLLVGGTGAVGCEVLRLALADERFERVIAPTRRPLAPHARLDNPVLDLAKLPEDSPYWRVDAVICTLGTTIKVAGSRAAFAAVDRDLPVFVARCAKRAGATRFAFNSSLGANPKGNFYLRTKAQAEQAIRGLGYPSYTVVRPSLIDADRAEARRGERFALVVARVLRPLIPRRYRSAKATAIAATLLTAVVAGIPGERTVESEDIH
jgi:uncharacterized protein YbjT (DUF2867 family)